MWAPHARTVDVVVPGPGAPRRRPLRLVGAHKPGYWGADTELAFGTTFGYSIDGGEPVADPTGTWFPDGVHGLSRVLPPLTEWTDDTWQPPEIVAGALLHLDVATATPAGTFDAAAMLLPRVARAGVQGVELAPVSAYDEDAGPAAGVRLFAVHEPLGGITGLARFVDTAHAHGLAVVLTPPHRWAATPATGLDRFGAYTADGRLNLAGGGRRGLRDLLSADAERWFAELHVDGLALDADALADRSAVPYVAELAAETLATSDRLGRPLILFVDGPRRSDRLTGAVRRLLAPDGLPDPAAVDDLRHLSATLAPTTRLPLRAEHRWVRRGRHAPRAASVVVGNLTRLPGARTAMPWAPPGEARHPADLETRAGMLTFAMLAGTPLVLDIDHVPVTDDSAEAARLLDWCAALAAPRAETVDDIGLALDLRVHGTVLVVRRGRQAVAVARGRADVRLPLSAVLPHGGDGWELRTAWSPAAAVRGDDLLLPGRTTAVLRARS
ncbi:1 4-alpha-glucan branching enzyme-like protein [Xylanimonas cellulosilytica DSM 15894]|uniref:1 4-alpha-glucan branching enzyme-like protein n=1 Tax=Xylanimonas cellulosilytica (strain DSM 15894 / JCM 12276 / CECT 5975 / KCTC 9989 / LMG 20990 / NBRC 107835 / XIL07) TaxID=446471 RepID=D1BT58_XYLCX|nr:1 4-alpha-glucan branching enzyme-like protein [Xylanimonas cellulosilytica DSM 15894]